MQLKLGKDSQGNYHGPMLNMMNRHGIITGATGTGKTVTLKLWVEQLSEQGVPTFLVDIKGDLNGFERNGAESEKLAQRMEKMRETLPDFQSFPVHYWDLFGENGLPIRTTISDMGPLLISRLLDLNETQTGIMHTVFKFADDQGLLLLDFKDFRAVLETIYENLSDLPSEYAGMNKNSLGAILRQVTTFEQQRADLIFGERALDVKDFCMVEGSKGVINLLSATKLYSSPKLYSTFLLWLLSELYEQFEEVGDCDQPKMVFFFDEAHLIFDKIPAVLLDQIEQVVRLIRSKGIGIYFITQTPNDLPDSVLSQLGNRIQHALRAYTAKEIKSLKLAVQGFRLNPKLDLEQVILSLGVGEAVVSFLDAEGTPGISEKVDILCPKSQFGHVEDIQVLNHDGLTQKYQTALDRESAFELLSQKALIFEPEKTKMTSQHSQSKDVIVQPPKKKGRPADSPLEKVGKSFMSSIARSLGSSLARGLMGVLKKMS